MMMTVRNEFVLITAISLVLTIIITVIDIHFLRVALGIPFVLFFPGYTLIAALFPGREDLDGIARVALSFGLSIAVVPLIGLALNYTPWGIRLNPILVSLLIFILAMSFIGWCRRKKLPEEKRLVLELNVFPHGWKARTRLDKALSVLLALAIIFAAGSLAYVMATPKAGEKFTEFYVLGPGGKAEGYPGKLKAGQEAAVILGVVNQEYRPQEYRVEVRAADKVINSLGPIALKHKEKHEIPLPFSINKTGQKIKVEFLLYRKGDTAPYRNLHLWVDVIK